MIRAREGLLRIVLAAYNQHQKSIHTYVVIVMVMFGSTLKGGVPRGGAKEGDARSADRAKKYQRIHKNLPGDIDGRSTHEQKN